jgi:polysaccharide biosynthesis/export protein
LSNLPSPRLHLKGKILVFIILLILGSCVPNKRLLYLQKPVRNEADYPTDTVIKSYALQYKIYRLKPNDVISLRVGSITPEEFNFIKEYEEQLGEIRKLYQYQISPTSITGAPTGQQSSSGIAQSNLNTEQTFSSILLDRYKTGFMIDSKGNLALPRIGVIQLAGLTLEETQNLIEEKLRGYFETPIVRVQLLSFYFTILGEVKNEGRYIALDPKFNVFDAFMMAGNLNEFADRSKLKIIRQVGDQANVIYINPLDEGMLEAKNYYLQPGDLIVVPPLHARYYRKYVVPDLNTTLAILTAVISLFILIQTLKK